MRWIIYSIFFLASIVAAPSSGHAVENDLFKEITNTLVKSGTLRADFYQKKSIRALSRPLISKGHLIFLQGKGVLWEVAEPFRAQMLIQSDRLVEWTKKGVPKPSNFSAHPGFKALSSVIISTFSGNFESLTENFDTTNNLVQRGWWLTLQPKNKSLSMMFSRIEIRGNQFVEHISLIEARGDQTDIEFSGFKTTPLELNKREKTYFEN
jgi:hypothetical protein